jgi:hypothetical protein
MIRRNLCAIVNVSRDNEVLWVFFWEPVKTAFRTCQAPVAYRGYIEEVASRVSQGSAQVPVLVSVNIF